MPQALDSLALQYSKLVLALGRHDASYVDAFYGPAAWKEEVEQENLALETLQIQARVAMERAEQVPEAGLDSPLRKRRHFLIKQLRALAAHADMLSGRRCTFDEESLLLYDAVAPIHGAHRFRATLDTLAGLLPGTGTVGERYHAYMAGFIIPKERLESVFSAALHASRALTQRWIPLPEGEDFAIEFVTDKPWSGYNWFKGNAYSVIQMNTDFPIYLDRALDLACHEGYPGHHAHNSLLEARLFKGRGWVEFCTYPLFSPQSLIAEGTANVGIDMVFPKGERTRFEREVLFPLAGLDASEFDRYEAVRSSVEGLNYASNEAARQYLDGQLTREETLQWLLDHTLATPDRAEQRLQFIEANRSYVINYNLGQDLVKHHIESRGGTPDEPERRWELFKELISEPWTASAL